MISISINTILLLFHAHDEFAQNRLNFAHLENSTRHKSTHYLIFICMFDRANIFLKGHQSEK